MSSHVQISRYNGIIEVKLNKPKVNSIDTKMSRELAEAFSELRDNDDILFHNIKNSNVESYSDKKI